MINEIKQLGSSVLIYGVGQVLIRVLMLLLLPIFTAYLSPAEYGVSSILAILAFIVVPLFSLGLGAGMGPCYFEGNSPWRKAATISTTGALLLASCSVLIVMALYLDSAISILAFQSPRYAGLVRLTLIGAVFTVLAGPYMQYLQFEKRARLYVMLMTITTILTVVATVWLIVFLRRGVRGMVEANVIGQLACLVLFFSSYWFREQARPSWPLAVELLRLGIVLLPAFGFQFVLQQGNKYILQQMRGLASVGVYTIGWSLGLAMGILVTAFGNAWYAYFMQFLESRETARVLFARLTTTYVLIFGAVSAMFFIFAKPVVMLLTQPAYIGAYLVVGLSATAQLLNGLYLMLLPGLYFEKKVKYTTVVYAIASVASVGLNILFIWRWGMLGAGIGLAVSHFALVAVQYSCNRIKGFLEIRYEWRRIGRFGLLYFAAALAGLWQRQLQFSVELAVSCVGAALFLFATYRLFTDDERNFLRELLTRSQRGESRNLPATVMPDAPPPL